MNKEIAEKIIAMLEEEKRVVEERAKELLKDPKEIKVIEVKAANELVEIKHRITDVIENINSIYERDLNYVNEDLTIKINSKYIDRHIEHLKKSLT